MMRSRLTRKRPRFGGNSWLLLLILAILGVSIWVMTPSGSSALHREKSDLGLRLGLDLKGGVLLAYRADLSEIDDPSGVMSGTIDVIENRINALGVSEPIIRTPADAYECFRGTDLDYLVMDDFVVSKH